MSYTPRNIVLFAFSMLLCISNAWAASVKRVSGFNVIYPAKQILLSCRDTLPVIHTFYVTSQNGAKAYTKMGEDAGWCFDYSETLSIVAERDSLWGVDTNDGIFYIRKIKAGSISNLLSDNEYLNKSFELDDTEKQRYSCEEDAETVPFNSSDYPDIEVNAITRAEYERHKKNALPNLVINKAIIKTVLLLRLAK